MNKKNLLIGAAIAAVSAGVTGIIGEVKAHRKYKKGCADGMALANSINKFEEYMKQFNETHEVCKKKRG